MHKPRLLSGFTIALLVMLLSGMASPAAAVTAALPPQGTQPDSAFAASYAASHVTNVSATAQRISCYAPELTFYGALTPADGYLDGGMSPCDTPTTGEDLGPYPTQNVSHPAMRVKDHAESDIRVDPLNPSHLIGQSKWAVSAEGYNHLLGFYESFDGGETWPVQGHVPGYEGWVDNTDPVGAFDPWGNFYSLVLSYNFYYDKSGYHQYNNGSNQTNPTVPPEAVAVAVHPAVTLAGKTPAASWITTHNGHLDTLMTAPNATTNDPDKQWIIIDVNPTSPHYGRIYAMWTVFVLSPSVIYVSYADASPDGTHTDWSAPKMLPTVSGKPWDTYLMPQVAPDGTVYTTTTSFSPNQSWKASINLVWSTDGGVTWKGPLPVAQNIAVPTYANTTFREGIVNTFAVGPEKFNGSFPLYVSYEDGSSGFSNIFLSASYNGGVSWTAPILVNDNASPADALQPNLVVAPDGTVGVAFYDRRLACPMQGDADAVGSGVAYDPGTASSPGHPWGRGNYCINTAIEFYTAGLTPIGQNIRLSAHTWDPQLSAYHPSCYCSSTTFIGDYFGVTANDQYVYTTSVSTFNDAGENPFFHQQQIVARIHTP